MSEELDILISEGDAPLTFTTLDQLKTWFDAEQSRWEWAMMGTGINQQWGTAPNVANAINAIHVRIDQHEANGRPIAELKEDLEQHYRPSGPLIYSEGAAGENILLIKDSLGTEAGSFAYAFQKGWAGFGGAGNPTQLRAGMLMAMPELKVRDDLSALMSRERTNFKNGLRSSIHKIETEYAGQAETRGADYARNRTLAWRMLKRKIRE